MVKIFSIKEEYTKKIYSKNKLLELRRQNINIEINELCLIYTTMPIKKITGYFIVKKKIRLPLNELWEITKKNSGINKEKFLEYFSGCKLGTAIIFKKVKRLVKEIGLNEIRESNKKFMPPQSYFNINLEIIKIIEMKVPPSQKEFKKLLTNAIIVKL